MPGQVLGAYSPTEPGTGRALEPGTIGPWMPDYWKRLAEVGWMHNRAGTTPAPLESALGRIPLDQISSFPSYLQQWLSSRGASPTATPTQSPTVTPTANPVATPTSTPTAPSLPTVGRMAAAPAEVRTPISQQPSPLMQMLNFPRLRTKKPAPATGGTTQGGVGQYNENFWNAWRL